MRKKRTDNFLLGAQHAQLPEADVKGGTLEGAIRLSHHDDIDSSCQSGRVEAAVELLHRHKHRLRKLAHDIHGLGLKTKKQNKRRSENTAVKQKVSAFAVFRRLPFDQ